MKIISYSFFFWILLIGIISFMILGIQKFISKNKVPSIFVTANGDQLYVDNHIFRSIGVNRYNLLAYDTSRHCANSFTEKDIDTMFANLHTIGVTSIRFWLFQSFTNSGQDLKRFNYILKKAKQYNIRLIPVFENHWHDCTQGEIKPDAWYQSAYLKPYGTYPLSLKAYIGKVVPLYKDNPTILAWQVMNEAESSDHEALYNFTKDVSEYIKSLDSNHLVSIGTSGTKQSKDEYRKLYSLASIDILTYHDYADLDSPLPDDLQNRFEDSSILLKPLIVGEAGMTKDVTNRSYLLGKKMNAFFEKGGSAYLIWSYGEESVTDDGNNFDFSDPLAEVVKFVASKIESEN